jgi:ketosteroid isomerase-like protein
VPRTTALESARGEGRRNSMSVSAPGSIGAYFRAIADDDSDALIACFTDDAEVSDEGNIHRGPEEIRAWRERTRSAYRYTADVLGTDGDGDHVVVTTRLTGDFPGSPVEVPYHFALRDGLISRLDIDP